MPKLSLVFLRQDTQKVGAEEIHFERIKALLAIGNSGQVLQDCIVDTGCTLSLFPQRQWERFDKDISWLYTPGSRSDLPDWLCKATGLGATAVDCQIGKVTIQIIELPTGLRTPSVEIIAKFPLDNGGYSQILLGLGGKAFSNWDFTLRYGKQSVWLEF